VEGEPIRLVVGLGNPGERYAGTRHNVGFLAVDCFVEACDQEWGSPPRGNGQEARVRLAGDIDVRVAKPYTFMNASGDMVQPLAQYRKIPASSVLVVADDFNLPLGTIRIRSKGSAGGQKGLESILQRFGTQEVPRIRLGIGPVPSQYDPADFVLGRFSRQETEKWEEMTERASEAIRVCCEKGLSFAMNSFNGSGE